MSAYIFLKNMLHVHLMQHHGCCWASCWWDFRSLLHQHPPVRSMSRLRKFSSKKIWLPSSNQTWQRKTDHLSVIFLVKPPFSSGMDFPLPCLITWGPEGNVNYTPGNESPARHSLGPDTVLSGNQTWQLEIPYNMEAVIWEHHVHMFDFPLPCLITGE